MAFNLSISGKKPLKSADVLHFLENLYDLLEVGMSINSAVGKYVPAKKEHRERFRKITLQLKKGRSFAFALRSENLLKEDYLQAIETSEQAGLLKNTIHDLIQNIKKQAKFKSTIVRSMTMPVIEIVAAVIVSLVAIVKIIPSMAEQFKGFKEIPEVSQRIFQISYFIRDNLLIIVIVIVTCIVVGYYLNKDIFQRKSYTVPVLGPLKRYLFVHSLFYRVKILVESGYHIQGALEMVAKSEKREYERYFIEKFIFFLKKGFAVDEAIRKTKMPLIPEDILAILETLKYSSNVKRILGRIVEIAQDKSQSRTEKVASIMEPVTVFFIAIVVFLLVISVYYPVFTLVQTMGG